MAGLCRVVRQPRTFFVRGVAGGRAVSDTRTKTPLTLSRRCRAPIGGGGVVQIAPHKNWRRRPRRWLRSRKTPHTHAHSSVATASVRVTQMAAETRALDSPGCGPLDTSHARALEWYPWHPSRAAEPLWRTMRRNVIVILLQDGCTRAELVRELRSACELECRVAHEQAVRGMLHQTARAAPEPAVQAAARAAPEPAVHDVPEPVPSEAPRGGMRHHPGH